MLVHEAFVILEARDEPEPLRAFHVAARAQLQLSEGAGFVVRKERCAIGEHLLVLEPGGAHRARVEAEVEQLDVIDVVLALEIGHDRRRKGGGIESLRIVRRTETHRLPARER